MVILERPVKVEAVGIDADLDHSEAAPFFYSVPCAGVKYYTFDYRRALRMRISRWAHEDQPKRLIDCG